ncbi:hypothetical protein ONZ45_g14733 [Pleurotus djamor]|nr:hypothetical protein ONZ45_g14733 [Pleurotus djamor]
MNAYDDVDDIVIDISVYDDHSVIDSLYLENLRHMDGHNGMTMGHARRFVLPNVSRCRTSREAVVAFTVPEQYPIELPTVNPAFYHKRYQYAYGISRTIPGVLADKIVKLDMSAPTMEPKMWGAPGYTVGEPIFVPRPTPEINEPSNEDNGVILTVVLDAETQKSMLVILDAKEMSEVARAEMETAFPFGFHGAWVHRT